MFFNKLTYPLVLMVLLVAGLTFVPTAATVQGYCGTETVCPR